MKNINIKLILKIVFSFSLLLFLFFKLDLSVLLELEWTVFIYIFFASIITIISLLVMSYRYKLMVSEFLDKQLDTLIIFKYYMIGMFFNIFLPGAVGGDVIRIKKLAANHGVSVKNSTAITIGERLTGLYGLLLLSSLSLFFQNFPNNFKILDYVPSSLLKLAPFLVVFLIPVSRYILTKFKVYFSFDFAVKTVVVILLAQMGDILIAYLFSNFMGLDVEFTAYIFIMPIVYISTVLPISLGGLGVREGVFSGLLMLYGVDTSIAISISLLMYFTKLLVGLIGYVVYLKDK